MTLPSALHRQALTILSQTHNLWQQAIALRHLARTYHCQENTTEAINHDRQAQAILHQIGHRWEEARTLLDISNIHRTASHADAARESCRQALDILEELGDPSANEIRAHLNDLTATESPTAMHHRFTAWTASNSTPLIGRPLAGYYAVTRYEHVAPPILNTARTVILCPVATAS